MIDWVSIVRHSRRRFSNYVGTRAPIRIKKRRRTPISAPTSSNTGTHSPQDDRHQYTCCCTHNQRFKVENEKSNQKCETTPTSANSVSAAKRNESPFRALPEIAETLSIA